MFNLRGKTFSDKTNYSKLFKNTYWGNFGLDNRSEKDLKELDEIVTNRNNFVVEYNIKKNVKKRPIKLLEYIEKLRKNNSLDHLESYLTNNNEYIIVNSPYNPDEKAVPDMQKIYNLYFNNAKTYIKIISKDELKKNNKDYLMSFYEKHKELKENDIICEICNQKYKYFNKSKHCKTKIHKYAQEFKNHNIIN
jgi:hypothetical protein